MSATVVDTSMLSTLVGMGFPEVESRNCLEAINNSSIEDALELLSSISCKAKEPVKRIQEKSQSEDSEEEGEEDSEDDSDLDMVEFVDEDEEVDQRREANTLDETQMLSERANEVTRVASILDLDETPVNHLLREFNWDSQKLLEQYFADPEAVLKKVDLHRPNAITRAKSLVTCGICFCEVRGTETLILGCEHLYCKDCWEGFLEVKINDGETDITCMGPKCKRPLDAMAIQKIVSKELLTKYMRYSAQDFVDSNPNCTWCCDPKCGKAVQRRSNQESNELICVCGARTCLGCTLEWHAPATCEEIEKWEAKAKDDSETYNWIKANTKACPKCKKAIEKNGGCNHMTCKSCRFEFCWICLSDYRNHSSCNQYEKDKDTADSKTALDRYLHHFTRYVTHQKSRQLETTLKETALHKMEELQNSKGEQCWIDVQYISDATDALIKCRRVLMYTYVRSFFLPACPGKSLFEYNQGLLESATENLSHVLEGPAEELERRRVTDLANVATTRKDHLLLQSEDIIIESYEGKKAQASNASSMKPEKKAKTETETASTSTTRPRSGTAVTRKFSIRKSRK